MFRLAENPAFLESDLQNVFLADPDGLSPIAVSPPPPFATLPQDDQVTLPDIAILNDEIPSPPLPQKPKPLIVLLPVPQPVSQPPLTASLPSLSLPFLPPPPPHPPVSSPLPPAAAAAASAAAAAAAAGGVKSPLRKRRDHHNTHTRRCRARLNTRFDSLSRMLVPLSSSSSSSSTSCGGSESRQKVQVLDRAIHALKTLHAENERLGQRLALRSPRRMLEWVDGITRAASASASAVAGGAGVQSGGGLARAVGPFARLVCEIGGFPYAELWGRETERDKVARLEEAFVHGPAMLRGGLSALAEATRGVGVPVALLADAVFERGAATWFGVGRELQVERRARLAEARIRGGFAVPVPVAGCMTHAVVFYDVREREVDAEVNRVASFGAVAIGNAYGCPARGGWAHQ